MTRSVLFSTPHGSHLYGLAHAGSDRDRYTVVTRLPHVGHNGTRARYARQTIRGDEDDFVIDISSWLRLCEKGVPQALEAMWSRSADVDTIGAFRASYRAGSAVIPTYLRTIRSFALGDFKRRRHSLRLALNARSILAHGYFDPLLTEEEALWATRTADLAPEAIVRIAESVAWGHLSPA